MKPESGIIIVTGSNGRIGEALMRRLAGRFTDVIGFDRKSPKRPPPGCVDVHVRRERAVRTPHHPRTPRLDRAEWQRTCKLVCSWSASSGAEATTGRETLAHEVDLNAGHRGEREPAEAPARSPATTVVVPAPKEAWTKDDTRMRNSAHSETEIKWRLTMKRILVFGLACLLAPALVAQMPAGEKPAMMDCAAMMQQHEAMQKHMAEMDAKLQTLVADMNKAKGSAKVDKTAAVVTELVAQRSMMQKKMMDMHPKMMEHMTQHMQSGMMKGMADSMSNCPMMKGADKATAPAAAEHKH